MSIRYTSELAAKSLGIAAEGTPYAGPACRCIMCRRPIEEGDLHVIWEAKRSFADFHKLGAGNVVCGFCAATTEQSVMRNFQRAVITEHGVYEIGSDAQRAWLWLTPPEPPFAVVINHNITGTFHYHWRTPVTLDKDLIRANIDGTIYDVRRTRVLQALEHSKVLIAALSQHATTPLKKEVKSPFVVLQRQPADVKSDHGLLRSDIRALRVHSPEYAGAINFLDTLAPGELHALSPFLKQNPAEPITPPLNRSI